MINNHSRFVVNGPWSPEWMSVETLLDILIVLYDECGNSTLRREKSVKDFLEWGKYMNSIIIICCVGQNAVSIHQF